MAKVLGQIAERLKTDLGELARATVDPDFSRRRDLSNFENDKHERNRQEALADQARIREEKRQDEDRLLSNRLQLAAVTKTFDNALNTGEWNNWAKVIENRSSLSPEFRTYVERLNANSGSKSLDRLEAEAKWEKEKIEAELNGQKFLLEQDKYITDKDQWFGEQDLKDRELRFKLMKDLRETHADRNNRQSMIEFVRNTPDIETKDEREAFELRLKQAKPNEFITVWDEIMARLGDRKDRAAASHRARVMARALAPTSPTPFLQDFSRDVLIERVPEFENMSPENQDKMTRFMSERVNELSREDRTANNRKVLQAVEATRKGINVDEDGGFAWFDIPGFSVEQSLREKEDQPTNQYKPGDRIRRGADTYIFQGGDDSLESNWRKIGG